MNSELSICRNCGHTVSHVLNVHTGYPVWLHAEMQGNVAYLNEECVCGCIHPEPMGAAQ